MNDPKVAHFVSIFTAPNDTNFLNTLKNLPKSRKVEKLIEI